MPGPVERKQAQARSSVDTNETPASLDDGSQSRHRWCCCRTRRDPPAPLDAIVGRGLIGSGSGEVVHQPLQRVKVIVNPTSGSGHGLKVWKEHVKPILAAHNIRAEVFKTTHGGHGEELMLSWAQNTTDGGEADIDAVIAIGGDGTFHEVVNGNKGVLPIGFVAAGTGNCLLKSLGPADVDAAIAAIVSGRRTPIDVGRCTVDGGVPRLFINLVGVGLPAAANHTADGLRAFGKARYDLAGAWHIIRLHGLALHIAMDGVELTGDYVAALIQNTQHGGSQMRFAPTARLNDGVLDLVLLKKGSRLSLAALFLELKRNGSHVFHREVECHQFRQLVMTQTRGKMPLTVDGEDTAGGTVVNIEVLPNFLPTFV